MSEQSGAVVRLVSESGGKTSEHVLKENEIFIDGGKNRSPVITFTLTPFLREMLNDGDKGIWHFGCVIKQAYEGFVSCIPVEDRTPENYQENEWQKSIRQLETGPDGE
jgi:hypothetical protein